MTWKWQLNGTPNSAVNLSPATGAVAVFNFKEMLKQLGWVVKASSDGSTFNSTGDQITTGATGAGGFANNSAWFRIQDPATLREFTWQRGTTNLVARVKWSHSSKFTGGSPGTTQTPSAADETIIRGGGTDASPTFTTVFGADASYRFHAGGDDATPYYFWYRCTSTTGPAFATTSWGLFISGDRGTYPYQDNAPYIIEFGQTTAQSASNVNGTPFGGYYFKKGLAGEAFVSGNAGNYAGFLFGTAQPIVPASAAGQSLGVNPYTGNDNGYPIPVGRSNNLTQPGHKIWLPMTVCKFPTTFRNQFDFEDETATPWVATTGYVADQLVLNGSNIYRCVTAGTSAGSGGPTGTSNSITDNTVVWTFVTITARYSLLDVCLFRSPPGVILS